MVEDHGRGDAQQVRVAAQPRFAGRVHGDHEIGRAGRRGQQLPAGHGHEGLGQHQSDPGRSLPGADAQLPQGQADGEHAAQRVTVRVDMADEQDALVGRDGGADGSTAAAH